MLKAMRRADYLGVIMLGIGLLGPLIGAAEDGGTRAAAIADRQDSEERYRRLSSSVEDLLASQAVLQKRISSLAEDLRGLREEQSKPNTTYVTRDELKRLAEQLQEIDRKREADKRLILEEIQKLAKIPAPVSQPHSSSGRQQDKSSEKERIENGYWHVVDKDETLSLIIQAYRQKGVKVTRKVVEEANPTMNPNRLLRGQKVFIPDPAK